MIIKQNSFVISNCALNALKDGNYVHRQKFDINGVLVDVPISYCGSSLQRNRPSIYEPSTIVDPISAPNRLPNKRYIPLVKKDDAEIQHTMSKKSKQKIVNKVTAWTRANRLNKHNGLYNFITLTLTSSQIGTDKDFTKMLNVFFTYCRKYYSFKNYLYVLERQKNGNIHAHIIIDRYVNYERLNSVWCKVLGKHGYTFQQKNYITGKVATVNVADALRNYSDSRNYYGSESYVNSRSGKFVKPTKEVGKPNPCDVDTVHSLKTLSRYITKYITKNESVINTSLWNCSQSISRLWTSAIVDAREYYAPLWEHVSREIRLILDNGFVFVVNLLKFYTKEQQKIFDLNKNIICY